MGQATMRRIETKMEEQDERRKQHNFYFTVHKRT